MDEADLLRSEATLCLVAIKNRSGTQVIKVVLTLSLVYIVTFDLYKILIFYHTCLLQILIRKDFLIIGIKTDQIDRL